MFKKLMNRDRGRYGSMPVVIACTACLLAGCPSDDSDDDPPPAPASSEATCTPDSEGFDSCARSSFSAYARETGGALGAARSAAEVPDYVLGAIVKAVEDHGPSFDLVFIIDRTSSMGDDIYEVQQALDIIIDKIEEVGDGTQRVGVFVYGDQCADPSPVYEYLDLTADLDVVRSTINAITVFGGGDILESVNEAIVLAMENFSWERPSRYAILIGDAGPHVPGDGCYTTSTEEAVAAAKATGVLVNFYPILVSVF